MPPAIQNLCQEQLRDRRMLVVGLYQNVTGRFPYLEHGEKDINHLKHDTCKSYDLKKNSTLNEVIFEYHNKKIIAIQSQINFWHKCVS